MSARKLGIGEAVGLVFGLIGIGIQMRWPDQKWLGWVFIVLGIAIALGFVIWVVAQHQALKGQRIASHSALPSPQLTQHAPITNVFAPNLNQTQSQSQEQHQTQERALDPPVSIEHGLAQIEQTKTDRYSGEVANLYRSTSDDPDNTLVDTDVAFAKFRRDDESPVGWINAKATIEFFNSKSESCFKVDRAYWWAKEGEHGDATSFRVGDTRKMIVALVGSEGRVFPYSGHYVAVDRVGPGFRQEFVLL